MTSSLDTALVCFLFTSGEAVAEQLFRRQLFSCPFNMVWNISIIVYYTYVFFNPDLTLDSPR